MSAFGDRLLRAQAWSAFDARDAGDRDGFTAAVVEFVRLHRLLPRIEYAHLVRQAADSEEVLEAAVRARTADLEAALVAARRDATLAWAQVAALEVLEA